MTVPTATLIWDHDDVPCSAAYGDVYFSREDGLAESRAVFLAGCGLPAAWKGRERFTIAELGFGSGLNVLAVLAAWAEPQTRGGRLHLYSVEAHPLTREDATRALVRWPELAAFAGPLLARWPGVPGVTRIDWPALGATLDVCVGEAAEALAGWDGRADAWFLDGFSPATNPAMWRDEVLALIASRSAADARLATFTVAGAVRRGLEATGWSVEKRPGFGGKKQRLEARRTGGASPWRAAAANDIVVLGAGIAGASVARALAAEGRRVRVIGGLEPGASAGPAALVTPRFDRGGGAVARLSAQAFHRALALYPEAAVIARGVRRLGDPVMLAPHAASPLFDGLVLDDDTLWMPEALTIEPRIVLDAWLRAAERLTVAIARVDRGDRWRLLDAEGRLVAEADTLVFAAGWGLSSLQPDLPLQAVRGQLSTTTIEAPEATVWGGYVAPTRTGVMFGATHDRGDETADLRTLDAARNLAALRMRFPAMADAVEAAGVAGWAAVRAATPDHLPIAGELAPGLLVLTGLGSRGFSTAPLLGEHLAALITGAPSPLPLDLQAAVDPGRFAARAAKRGSRARHPALTSEQTPEALR